MKSFFRKLVNLLVDNRAIVLTFIAGIVSIGGIYKMNQVLPFGKKSLLCVDFYHQYGPMMAELYDRIRDGGSLIYSFNAGLGLPFFRNFYNYLSSPLNILMLLFKKDNLLTSYSLIIGLKPVLAACTMSYYLGKKFKTKEMYFIPISLLYGFQTYFQAYYWNIMWLDGMYMIPLVALGIEELVNNNKWKLYTFSLAYILFTNYFIGYTLCIFSTIYFILYLIYKMKLSFKDFLSIKKLDKNFMYFINKSIKFGIVSVAAAAIVSWALLPMASSMSSISATKGTMPSSNYYDFKAVDFLKGHLSAVKPTVFASDEITNPNVSLGILSVGLILLYMFNVEIKIKNKIIYLLMAGFFIACFFFAPLDYIMHAFHVPNDLPYRYSFIYTFILAVICAYSIKNINKVNIFVSILGYLFLMTLLISISRDNWQDLSREMIFVNMILLTLYFIFYLGQKYLPKYKETFQMALIIIACIEVGVSVNTNWNISQDSTTFYQDYDNKQELLEYVEKNDDELFYRIENTTRLTLNDASWYNYHGMTTFSSMAYESLAKFQNRLGMPGNEINSYYYVNSTPVYDLMFDIKYSIGNQMDEKRYTTVYKDDDEVQRFDYNVGLAYGVNNNILSLDTSSQSPFYIQNDFINKAANIQSVFEPINPIKTKIVYEKNGQTLVKYTVKNTDNNMYFYTKNYRINYFILGTTLYHLNDLYLSSDEALDKIMYTSTEDYAEKNIINISTYDEEFEFYVSYNYYDSPAFDLYKLNQEKFEKAYEILNSNKLTITSFKETKIEGKIKLDEKQIVYTSIPYDNGWSVYVDGKKAETYALADSLLVFKAPAGKHKITIKYSVPKLKTGIIISSITLIIILFRKYISYFNNLIKKKIDILLKKILTKKKELSKK